MALVGDIIMEMRTLGPDLPQVFPAPTISSAVAANVAGGNLSLATYFIVATMVNSWGESLPSAESTVVVGGGNNAIAVTFTGLPGSFVPGGTYTLRVYIGTTAGQESNYQTFVLASTNATVNLTNVGMTVGVPPLRSTAFVPDTDGGMVSAAQAFRWLNEALKKAALITGGIQDWGGAGSTANQPMYRPPVGVWRKFDHCWYDGWELEQGNKAEIFRNRPLTASISRIFAMDVNSAGQVVELYYIPSRTSGTTTTSATFNAADTTVTLTSAAGFSGPSFGLVLIGSEVCFYGSVVSNTLTGLTRALSGTVSPTSLASGATVRELNILWNGFRMPATYSAGQSSTVLDVPQGWESILPKYLLAKFREAEQSRQEAASLFKEFNGEFKDLASSNRQLSGPRQARIFDSYGFRGVVPAGAGGGLIIP